MTILVIQLKKLGDVILTAPALQSLRARFPNAHLTLVVDSSAAPLRPLFDFVDAFLVYEKGKMNLSLWRHLTTSSFDATLDFAGTDRSALMTRLSRAPKRVTSIKLGDKAAKKHAYNTLVDASVRDLHTVDYHQKFLTSLGIDSSPPSPALAMPNETVAHIDSLLADNSLLNEPIAILHPGTAAAEKFWPPKHWATLIDHLVDHSQLPTILTGGPAPQEQSHIQAIITKSQNPVLNLSTHTTLLHLAELIRRAHLLISVDTLALHFGDAFQVPQIGLFGPTNPHHWRPRHDNAIVLLAGHDAPLKSFSPRHTAAPMSDLSPESVIAALPKTIAPSHDTD
ncbi:MAG: glycosyltransferase family 9 protein [Verrucomicrobiota bacterium]